ncbi:hypothetical protein TraAM80_07434 [Trypanosoma rangeli]|uniref:Uncharacterized protein n=1 Tax=Trypanosoma rangeli TaxID=5698 RepID=A0A3R7K6E0_TRYRA|nr:uncharacterized protein TraAM80_07434 [Trypanosoma rangeli]RNF00702.1 hypothetical protein TraAM80_07434 [Trypanosoma rangeli]|eukprot:RNF00702.1 hypothetical protein TraAM80_07434 [Trypanosoma rangeli]
MPEGLDSLRIEENVLEALVHALISDRSACVAGCLPHILSGIAHGEPELSVQRRGRTHRCGEHAKAPAVTELLECALSSTSDATDWSVAEEEWNMFLRGIGSGRKYHSEARDSLKSLVGPATQALLPLLEFLDAKEHVSEKQLSCARGFYAHAVSHLLQVHLFGATEKEIVMWLRRHDWGTELDKLLRPFLVSEVEPLAKELAFHFKEGKKTARREESQHFFSFLLQLYERYSIDTRAHGWVSPRLNAHDPVSLIALGGVSLASIAVSVFCSVYGWYEGSKFLAARDFTVHGVNCFTDFLDRARGVLHSGAQLLLAESILFPSVFCIFLETARVTAERAFTTGARALWRREFLAVESLRAFTTVCGSHHMLRCLEAVIRRLAVVFSLLPTYAVSLWERTIAPCLSAFVARLEATIESSKSTLVVIEVSLEVLICVHAMYSAAEEWQEQCCGVRNGVEITLEPLERLGLWRDELIRRITHDINNFLTRLFAGCGFLERDLRAWDALLLVMARGKTVAHTILYEDMKVSLARLTSEEQRNHLREYCHLSGMQSIATLLENTME